MLAGLLLASCGGGDGETLNVAVAANFSEPAREIAGRFQAATQTSVRLSFGSTGQLFAQIRQDAPFEVFLAADSETPVRLVSEGLGVEESLFTYAVGALALYSTTLDLTAGESVLRQGSFERIAMANPLTAPYGRAAREAIRALEIDESLEPRIVEGNNVTQTFQFVETGNAELGFVALSQVRERGAPSVWPVPQTLYAPIVQDAVLLIRGAESPAALDFIDFLKTPEAAEVIRAYGYGTP
jgi:molybdate transport system substrate-binding protein